MALSSSGVSGSRGFSRYPELVVAEKALDERNRARRLALSGTRRRPPSIAEPWPVISRSRSGNRNRSESRACDQAQHALSAHTKPRRPNRADGLKAGDRIVRQRGCPRPRARLLSGYPSEMRRNFSQKSDARVKCLAAATNSSTNQPLDTKYRLTQFHKLWNAGSSGSRYRGQRGSRR